MSFWQRLWHAIVDAILRTSAHAAESAVQHVDVFSKLEEDTLNLVNSIRDLKQFDFDPQWRTRVISLPRAQEGIQELADIIFHGFRDKFAQLYQSILTLKAALYNQQIGHFGASVEPQGRLAKMADWFGGLYTGIQAFENSYRQLTDITAMIDDVKHRVETLDDLFLPQDSKKKVVEISYRKRNA